MILIFIIPIYILLNAYILHRIHKWLTACSERFHSKWFVVPYLTIYSLLALSLLFAFLLPASEFQVLVKRISNYWLGTFLYLLMFIAVADILRLILKQITGKIHEFFFCKAGYVFVGLLLTALICGISAYGILHSKHVKVTPYDITVEKSCAGHDSLKIVLAADLHLGYSVDDRQMQRMVKKINAQNADLVVFAGDVFDNEYEAVQNPDKIAKTLSTIQSTYGSYAVFGNHDVTERLLGGFSVTSKGNEVRDPRFESFLKDADITLLYDEVTCIDNAFYLVGRKDIQKPGDGTTNRKTIEELLSNVDKTKPVFVLEHQPKQLEELDNAGVDMQLCGHTHDGQIFPGNLTVKLFWENPCGYLKKGNLNSIVTSGVGVWGPAMRVGTDSEICTITVHFSNY